MADEAVAELNASVLVHFGEIEVVLVELSTELGPQSWLAGSEQLANVGSVSSVVGNDIGVEFAGNRAGEPPVHEDRVENEHA